MLIWSHKNRLKNRLPDPAAGHFQLASKMLRTIHRYQEFYAMIHGTVLRKNLCREGFAFRLLREEKIPYVVGAAE